MGSYAVGHTSGLFRLTKLVENKDLFILFSSNPQDLTIHLAQSLCLQIFVK